MVDHHGFELGHNCVQGLLIQPSANEDFEIGELDLELADIGTFVLFKSFDSDVVHVFFKPKEF